MTDTTKQIDRAAFEKAAGYAPHEYERNEAGEYINDWMTHIWMGYQIAARATPVSPAQRDENTVFASLPDILANLEAAYRSGASGEYGGNARQSAVAIMHHWDLPDAAPTKPQSDLHSAGTIDTPQFRALFRNLIAPDGEVWPMVITHINDWNSTSVAAARQSQLEGFNKGVNDATDYLHAKIAKLETALAAAREQALEEAKQACSKLASSHGMDDADAVISECEDAIAALKSTAPIGSLEPSSAPATVDRDAVLEAARAYLNCVNENSDVTLDFTTAEAATLYDRVRSGLQKALKGKAAPAAQAEVPKIQSEWESMCRKAVEVLNRHIVPDGISDHAALCELYGIFDSDEYRATGAIEQDRCDQRQATEKMIASLAAPAAVPQGVEAQKGGADHG